MKRKLLSHSAIYGMAPYIPKFASFLIYPLITANVTEYDYGIMAIIATYIGLFEALKTLGLNVVLTNSFYHNRNHYIWRWSYVFSILRVWNIFFSIAMFFLIYYILPNNQDFDKLQICLLLFIPSLISGPSETFSNLYFQLNKKPFQVAWKTILSGVITLILNFYTIVILKMGFLGWIWSTAITTTIIGLIHVYVKNKTLGLKPLYVYRPKIIKKYLKISLPLVPHYYSSYLLNTSDKLVMDKQGVPITQIGNYGFSYTFGNYFDQIGKAFGTALGPMLNELYKNNKHQPYRNLVFFFSFLFFTLTFSVSIFCKEIFEVLIKNETLKQLYPLTIVIIMSYNYRPMYIGVTNRYFFLEKTKNLWKISFAAGIFNLVSNIIFIPIYGYTTAIYTTFISLLYMGYSGYFLSMYKEIKNEINYYPTLWIAYQITLTIAAYSLKDSSVSIKAMSILIVSLPLIYWAKTKKIS